MIEKKKYSIMLAAAAFSVMITYLHVAVFSSLSQDIILEELYYIPLLLGAFLFGLRGALLSYAFVSFLYIPFLFGIGEAGSLVLADRLLHLFSSGLFSILAGFLVDRERKLQSKMEKEKYLSKVGQVATTIVHDLKNPLIVILGFAKRIRDGKGNSGEAAQTIIESAENMQRIVHDVLDFSKPIQLELQEIDLRNVIKEASDSCRKKAEDKGVILSADMPSDPVNGVLDSFKMQRTLINLINNAIEASGATRKVILTVSAKQKSVMIGIRDYGSGMDRETLEHIFIPFYTRKQGGTGLGMAIAKKIIEGHRGRLSVQSEVGKGTDILIELPLA
jgi:signal transduction histidine kinase